MRRKICLSIVLTFVSYYAFSIDVDTAKKVALSFFNQPYTRSEMVEPELLWDGLWDARTDDGVQPPFYVFGADNGGYVVVAGYEAAYPVLGFSRTASFDKDNLSPGETYLYQWMGAVVTQARVNGLMPTSKVSSEWAMCLAGEVSTDGNEVVLETADWDQRDPYNRLCPAVNGQRCVTGCVNTATAIIMHYHKWPHSGSGSLPSYKLWGREFGGHSLGHTYDWDCMPLNYQQGGFSDYQAGQVAQIMYDLGVMNESDYGVYETGTNLNYARLVEYFDYDPSILELSRTGFSDAEWEALIRNEIDAGRPVYFTGSDIVHNSHAFLIDGYRGRYFSMNLGWGGYDNRFYTLTLIDGLEQDMPYYYRAQDVVINIKPYEGGKPSCFLTKTNYIYIYDWNYKSGEPFNINKFTVLKSGLLDVYCCDLAYGLVDKDGHIKEIISSPVRAEIKHSFQTEDDVQCIVTSDLSADDTIRLCYRDLETNVWDVMHSSPQGILSMLHNSPLHSLCSVNYGEYIDKKSYVAFRELEIGVPIGVCLKFYDENGALIPIEDGRLICDEFEVNLSRSSKRLTLRKKRDQGYHKLKVQLYDMLDEYSFDVIF